MPQPRRLADCENTVGFSGRRTVPRGNDCATSIVGEQICTLFARSFASDFMNGNYHCCVLNMEGNKGPDAQEELGLITPGRCLSYERRHRTDDEAYWKGASRGVLISALSGKGRLVFASCQRGFRSAHQARGSGRRKPPSLCAGGWGFFHSKILSGASRSSTTFNHRWCIS